MCFWFTYSFIKLCALEIKTLIFLTLVCLSYGFPLNKTKKNTFSMGFKISEPSQQIKMHLYSKKNCFRSYNKHYIVFTSFKFVATILISRSYTLNDTGLTAFKRILIVYWSVCRIGEGIWGRKGSGVVRRNVTETVNRNCGSFISWPAAWLFSR